MTTVPRGTAEDKSTTNNEITAVYNVVLISKSKCRHQLFSLQLYFMWYSIPWFTSFKNFDKWFVLASWSEQWILFPENLNVSRNEAEGNIEIRGGTKFTVPPRNQFLSALLYIIKQNNRKVWKNALGFQRQHQATFNCTLWPRVIAVNISRVTINCFVWCHSFRNVSFSVAPEEGLLCLTELLSIKFTFLAFRSALQLVYFFAMSPLMERTWR